MSHYLPHLIFSIKKNTTAFLLEFIFIAIFCMAWMRVGAGAPSNQSLLFSPVPDAAEDVYVAYCFAHGLPPLLPIGNELHPSRYSPICPLAMALFLRLTGGGLGHLFSFSPLILLIGLAAFYGWMIRGQMPRLWRLLGLFLIMFSSLFVWASQSLMQEPLLFLFFALATLAWFEAMLLLTPDQAGAGGRHIAGLGLAFIAGLCGGALFCIRPTNAFLPFFYGVGIFMVLPGRRAMAAAGALGLGVLGAIIPEVCYIHHVAGFYHTLAYRHWAPENNLTLFSLHTPLLPYWKGRTPLGYYARLWLGIDPSLNALGWTSALMVGIGGLFGVAARTPKAAAGRNAPRQRIFRVQVLALGLFAFFHAALHLTYYFHFVRFFILAWPSWVVFAMAGFASYFQQHPVPDEQRKRLTYRLAIVLIVLLLSGFPGWKQAWGELSQLAGPWVTRLEIERQIRAHRVNGPRAAALGCPLFVDRLPVLNARLALGDFDLAQPIAPLCRETELVWDGHTVQFYIAKVGPARGRIDSRPQVWPANPFLSYLYDPSSNRVQKEFIERLLDRYGRIAVYYPDWELQKITPLFEALNVLGCRRERLTTETCFRLEVFSKSGNPQREISDFKFQVGNATNSIQ